MSLLVHSSTRVFFFFLSRVDQERTRLTRSIGTATRKDTFERLEKKNLQEDSDLENNKTILTQDQIILWTVVLIICHCTFSRQKESSLSLDRIRVTNVKQKTNRNDQQNQSGSGKERAHNCLRVSWTQRNVQQVITTANVSPDVN